jgi:glycerophosphoryl diester phosphodiesterase
MTRDWSAVRLIAHRCGGASAPENSLAGLGVAAAAGVAAVEFDVMLSADGVPVVIHDETLERTTDGLGPVAQRRLAELQRLSCSKGWPGFAAEPIPTLTQVLQRCHALCLLPNVEIKPSAGAEQATGRTVARQVQVEWVALGGSAAQVLLSSFSPIALQEALIVAPELPRAVLFEQLPDDWRRQVESLAAAAVHCAADRLDPARLAELQAAGMPVRCYTVNDPAQASNLFGQGVQAVFTDAMQKLREFR